jgi:hypothetical protein
MGDLLKLIWYAVAGLFRSRAALQAEVLALRHHLNVLRRRARDFDWLGLGHGVYSWQ